MIFLIFLLGLAIGSFLNCIIYRLEKKQSFLKGRSYCPHCKHNLMWLDLIPVMSFLHLRGQCRYCHKKISIQYPLTEIATGLIFLLIFLATQDLTKIDNVINVIFLFYIASVLIIIFVYDLRHYIILDRVLFPAIAITFFYQLIFNHMTPFGSYMLAVFVASGFFLVIFLISKGTWMGFGDVKLAVLLGLLLGFPNILLGLFLAFFLGAIVGSALMLFGKRGLKSEVPFAPFLIMGTAIAMLLGNQIIQWYINFLV